MKNLFVQFKSGRSFEVKDICNYVESQDFDIVVSRGDKKETHVTIFHDAVEFMSVTMDDISEVESIKKSTDYDDCRHMDVPYVQTVMPGYARR